MKEKESKILSRFVAPEFCSQEELKELKKWLSEGKNEQEINALFLKEWEKEDEKDTEVKFSEIQNRLKIIQKEKKNFSINLDGKIFRSFQMVAAILILPLILFLAYTLVHPLDSEPTYFQTATERGQKSNLILPDGTRVWLNSDSQLRYPDNFGRKNRNVELTGEAYFEVSKNKHKPFVVNAGQAEIKVLGTVFNLKSYPDDDEIETTLIEGRIEIKVKSQKEKGIQRKYEMKPGESLIYYTKEDKVKIHEFKKDEIVGWKNNQLIFRDDNFDKLVKKIERWYDVKIIYDQEQLKNQRLTVELYKGERLNRLLEIIELAINVDCKLENDKIYITPKK